MNPQKYPQRKLPRLEGYDYSRNGAYFVTIVTQNRINYFGRVTDDGKMAHNPAGEMLFKWWGELANKYPFIELDAFVVMPNHIHGIILFKPAGDHAGSPLQSVVGWYKTMTTNTYIRGVKGNNWRRFNGKLWQRTFHDRIIRDETELNVLRKYTVYNPALWTKDRHFSK